MSRDLTESEKLALESVMDSASLQSILMALSEICGGKAEHLLSNWQDSASAKQWQTVEGLLGFMVTNPTISRVSL